MLHVTFEDLRGAPGTGPLLGIQILSFSCSWIGALPSGKSSICHWFNNVSWRIKRQTSVTFYTSFYSTKIHRTYGRTFFCEISTSWADISAEFFNEVNFDWPRLYFFLWGGNKYVHFHLKLKTSVHSKRLTTVGVNLLYIQVKWKSHCATWQFHTFCKISMFQCTDFVILLKNNKYAIFYMEKSRKREMARK